MERNEEIVDACIARFNQEAPSEPPEVFFIQLVSALWLRGSSILSDVTLDVIFERALSTSTERFPLLASYKLDHRRLIAKGGAHPDGAVSEPQVMEAFRYFIVTILAFIENLTGTILLTRLYREIQEFSFQNSKDGGPQGNASGRVEENMEKSITNDRPSSIERVSTSISNLDEILGGGLPKGTITILAGPPGTGKTILSQEICFQNASPDQRVIFFQTLSEPTAKTLKYVNEFTFYDQSKVENGSIEFIDLGGITKMKGLQEGMDLIMDHVKRVKPAFVVIDSFKVFEDLAHSREELRKFSYKVVINLMAWECTTLLLGEFKTLDMETNPLFSIVDGVILLKVRKESSEEQRFIQVVKMRGTNHSRDEHSLAISEDGLGVYAPRVTIRRESESNDASASANPKRVKLGISNIDELLGEGIPAGSSILISGVAGTGKTLLSLAFIYFGAKNFGENGIFFSFEETKDRILAEARGMGWKIDELVNSGLIEIIFIPQPEILVEKHLLMMDEKITKMKARRVAIDSVSLFVHKIIDPQIVREKTYQLATLVQKAKAIGFFVTDISYGTDRLSRFGVEETVVDGVFLLTSSEKGYDRERFIEIYKIRNTAHLSGRHKMEIKSNGIFITPRDRLTEVPTGKLHGKTPPVAAFRPAKVPPARDSLRDQ